MDRRTDIDFWGITEHAERSEHPFEVGIALDAHIQSHWIAARRRLVASDAWRDLLGRDADDHVLRGLDLAARGQADGVLPGPRVHPRRRLPERALRVRPPDHGPPGAADPRRLPDRQATQLLPRPALQREARQRRPTDHPADGRARLPGRDDLRQPRPHLEAAVAGHQPRPARGAARGRPRLRRVGPAARGRDRAPLLPRHDRRDRRPARPPPGRLRPRRHHRRRGAQGGDRGRAGPPGPQGGGPHRRQQPRPRHLGVLRRLPRRARERRLRPRREGALQAEPPGRPEHRRAVQAPPAREPALLAGLHRQRAAPVPAAPLAGDGHPADLPHRLPDARPRLVHQQGRRRGRGEGARHPRAVRRHHAGLGLRQHVHRPAADAAGDHAGGLRPRGLPRRGRTTPTAR